jgi:hypothetical protein
MARWNEERRGRRLGRLVPLTLAALVAMTGVALATLTYRTGDGTLDAASRESFTRSCASGTNVTGGGILLDTDSYVGELSTTLPTDGPDSDTTRDDAWFARAYNASGDALDIDMFAICSDTGTFDRVKATASVPQPTFRKQKTASCPSGTDIVGGGAHITGNGPLVTASYPNSTHDGWVGVVRYNIASGGTSGTQTMTSYAICAHSGQYEYRSAGLDVTQQNTHEAQLVNCPSGTRVIGGGFKGTEPGNWFSRIQGSFPFNDDLDVDPDDGWIASMSSSGQASGPYPRLTVYAVCKE